MREVDEVLRVAALKGASDIHIQAGLPPVLRILTKLVPFHSAKLTAEAVEQMVLSIMSELHKKIFRDRPDLDFAYGVPGLARFRVGVR